jgi:hypothetical protein
MDTTLALLEVEDTARAAISRVNRVKAATELVLLEGTDARWTPTSGSTVTGMDEKSPLSPGMYELLRRLDVGHRALTVRVQLTGRINGKELPEMVRVALFGKDAVRITVPDGIPAILSKSAQETFGALVTAIRDSVLEDADVCDALWNSLHDEVLASVVELATEAVTVRDLLVARRA